jgi:hypothetical protein
LYIADSAGGRIRALDLATNTVSTFAGACAMAVVRVNAKQRGNLPVAPRASFARVRAASERG